MKKFLIEGTIWLLSMLAILVACLVFSSVVYRVPEVLEERQLTIDKYILSIKSSEDIKAERKERLVTELQYEKDILGDNLEFVNAVLSASYSLAFYFFIMILYLIIFAYRISKHIKVKSKRSDILGQ
jgi:predicted PurR-regulated permease PerM